MIVSGGENIYSAEIENVLSTHPAVAGVAVIGVPDARWGESVKAVVIVREGHPSDEALLIAHCRGLLAGYKLPKIVAFVDKFRLVPPGTVSKKHLRQPHWGRHPRTTPREQGHGAPLAPATTLPTQSRKGACEGQAEIVDGKNG